MPATAGANPGWRPLEAERGLAEHARQHAQPLWSSPDELRVGSALVAFCDGEGSTVPSGRRGPWAPFACQRRHPGGTIGDEVARILKF